MAIRNIVPDTDEILHKKCRPITEFNDKLKAPQKISSNSRMYYIIKKKKKIHLFFLLFNFFYQHSVQFVASEAAPSELLATRLNTNLTINTTKKIATA